MGAIEHSGEQEANDLDQAYAEAKRYSELTPDIEALRRDAAAQAERDAEYSHLTTKEDFEVDRQDADMLSKMEQADDPSDIYTMGHNRKSLDQNAIKRADTVLDSAYQDKAVAERASQDFGISQQEAFTNSDIAAELKALDQARANTDQVTAAASQVIETGQAAERNVQELEQQLQLERERLADAQAKEALISAGRLEDKAAGQIDTVRERLTRRAEPEAQNLADQEAAA